MEMNKKVAFIGTGNMGYALICAASKSIQPEHIYITDYDASKAEAVAREIGCHVVKNNEEAANVADYIFLCVKPQVIGSVLAQISPILEANQTEGSTKTLVSIAAGLTLQNLHSKLSADLVNFPLIRIMPNTPASIGMGMLALCAAPEVEHQRIEDVMTILSKAGRVEQLPEHLMDAFSAVGGCAPAYVYIFIEALADGAVMAGLSRKQALTYAAQTVMGSAAMVLETGRHPGELKDAVCSPAGSTIAGVAALERNGFRSAVIEAVIDSYHKNRDLNNN